LKIFGNDNKKTESQIQSLQQVVAALEAQLATAKVEHQKLDATAAKAQADAGKAHTEAAKAHADAAKALVDVKAQLQAKEEALAAKSAELEAAQAALFKAKHDGEVALSAVKNNAASHDHASAKAQEAAKAQLDAANKALTDATKALADANKALADARAQQAKTAQELEAKNKDLAAKVAELVAAQTATNAAKAEAAKAKQETDSATAAIKAQLEAKSKDLVAKAAELAAAQSATKSAQGETAKAKQDGEIANKAAADAKALQAATAKDLEAKNKELTTLKAERDKQAKLAQQTETKYQDSAQENELLLLQLMQAQEELVEYYEQKGEFEKLYLAYKARWERLEKRFPNYLDFGAIEIADVDGVSDVPTITWQVKDFAQAGVALSEFSFVTVLQDGSPGIGLVKDSQPNAFVPKLFGTNKDHLATFLGLGTTDFKQLTAAVSILDQLEAGQWAGFVFPAQFDLSFWRPSIQTLLAQLKQLPTLLRYDEVRLKRELINPDYEHLWLEFHGLSLGALQWKKFEIRLGAALVQAEGFSQYPKFEIPLIDGKTKPFDSWYAESKDDSGAKLELRFALDKNVFDVAVWTKLTDADKSLVLRVIYAMPDALKRLEKQKTAIHRPWATWTDFATAAMQVLESNKAAAKLQATEPPAQIEATTKPKALPAPTKVTSTGAKAGKVISITSKPAAKKTTTKTVRKSKA
jgi:hypothetical protein